jgi:hypothetical protein
MFDLRQIWCLNQFLSFFRIFSIRTGGEGARCYRRKSWFVFWCFVVSFGWDVGGVRGVSLDGCRWLFGFRGCQTI